MIGSQGSVCKHYVLAFLVCLTQHLDVLEPFGEYLVWTKAVIDHGRHAASFYYRNMIHCFPYLICQVAYRSDMVYAPIPESDSSGELVHSGMHTADWWCDKQI